jgi:hypothetical protein
MGDIALQLEADPESHPVLIAGLLIESPAGVLAFSSCDSGVVDEGFSFLLEGSRILPN